MQDETAKHFLRDLGVLVRDQAFEAKREADAVKGSPDGAFKLGCAFAYHAVVSLFQQQAAAFGIPLSELGLEGVNPERDLL